MPATLLKRDSSTGVVLLWILQNFDLFRKTSVNGCFSTKKDSIQTMFEKYSLEQISNDAPQKKQLWT